MKARLLGGAALALTLVCGAASAQIAVSGNGNKQRLVNGVNTVVANPPPDTITVLDLGGPRPRVLGEAQVPHSLVGPPTGVAITPDERFAAISSSQRIDPADPTRTTADNRVTLVDIRANPPRVVQTVEAGAGPSGLSFNHAGTLLLVANRNAGSVSVFRFQGGQLAPVSTLSLGAADSGPSHVQFTPDGRRALVTRDGDNAAGNRITVLAVDGETVALAHRDITAGIRPYGLGITPNGQWAAVANVGRGTGDADSVSLIDLRRDTYLTADTISVGATPEGVQVSPDNRHIAVTVHNGSARAPSHPLHGVSELVILRIENGRLRRVASAPIGDWAQGVAFSRDGRTVIVQNIVDRNLGVFRFDGTRLTDTRQRIPVSGGPAAIRTADR
ncbi:MAG TPA: beta-propeller fold lactonase family protein [Roseomonas sp.]